MLLGVNVLLKQTFKGFGTVHRPRSNNLLEICSTDIRISAEYQRCNNGYQEKIDQISIKHTDRFQEDIKKYQLDMPKYKPDICGW